ncbi:MAG: hypothetical protein HPY58_14095 [Firmicutes bacterium]|nr:hypothetical protein [Bacillota bacterium]
MKCPKCGKEANKLTYGMQRQPDRYFCPECCIEFTKTVIYKLTEDGGYKKMLIKEERLETVGRTCLVIKYSNGDTETVSDVERLGNVGGWMVIQMAGGEQMLINGDNVFSITEVRAISNRRVKGA